MKKPPHALFPAEQRKLPGVSPSCSAHYPAACAARLEEQFNRATGRHLNPHHAFRFPGRLLIALATSFFILGCGGDKSEPGKLSKDARDPLLGVGELPNPAGKTVLDELGVGDLQAPRKSPTSKKGKAGEKANEKSEETPYKRPDKWIGADDLPYEFWEVQFAGNRPIGYFHQKVAPSSVGSAGIYRIDADAFRRVATKPKPIDQFLKVMTIEEIDGSLRTLEASVKQGADETKIDGSVVLGSLRLKILKQGTTTGKEIPWEKHFGGPFAYTQCLRGDPMKPGEERSFSWLDPMTGELLKMELKAGKYIKTPLLDGKQYSLLEIVSKSYRGNQHDETTLWVDENGETLKSYNAAFDVRSYRSPRAMAEKVRDAGLCDALTKRSVELKKPIDDFASESSLTFRLICNERRTENFLPSRTNQSVRVKSAVTSEVVVHAMSEGTNLPDGVTPELKIADVFSKPSPVVASEDALVKKLAKQFIEADQSSASKLEKLRRGVFDWIKNKVPFSTEMAGAAEVARSQTGDSTEHAVLLAAVVRSLGVPSRIAGGMIYNGSESSPAMTYHCWTEVYLRDHWVSVDASIDDRGTNATYIKFVDSALTDENPYVVMLPVLRAIPDLEIAVVKKTE